MIRLHLPKWQTPLLNLWLKWKSFYHNPSLLQDQAHRNFTLEWPRRGISRGNDQGAVINAIYKCVMNSTITDLGFVILVVLLWWLLHDIYICVLCCFVLLLLALCIVSCSFFSVYIQWQSSVTFLWWEIWLSIIWLSIITLDYVHCYF